MWNDLELVVFKMIGATTQGTEDQIKTAQQQWTDFLAAVRKLVPPTTAQEAA